MKDFKEDPEKGCRWHFKPDNGGREDGPNDAMMQNFKSSPFKSLVREVIQNSLDAVNDHSIPVTVEFQFGELGDNNFKNFFELEEHIKECKNYFGWIDKAKEFYDEMISCFSGNLIRKGIGYIKIADYNTKGMSYDPDSSESPFYAFARSAGVSSKNDQESGGSFGFGKSAYFQISPISTILISSLTHNGEYNFEGVSWLSTHKYKGQKVNSVGYYDNNNGNPVQDPDKIPLRLKRKEAGTSFYILGFQDEDKDYAIAEMKLETLRSFWYAIYRDKLQVKIGDEEINSKNLDKYIKKYFSDEIDDTNRKECTNPRPYYKAVKEVDENNKVYKFSENLPILGECVLYIIKSDSTHDRFVHMRRPLMHVYGKRNGTAFGVNGIFICENKKGDEVLRNMENPAHDEWLPSNWKDSRRRKVEKGSQAESEIKDFKLRCLKKIFENSQDTAIEITGLDELLYIPEDLLGGNDESDHEIGTPTGNIKDSGLSLSTELDDNPNSKIKENDNANMGSVKVTMSGSSEESEEELDDTDIIGIHERTKRPARNRGGKPRAGDNFKESKIKNQDGTYRTYVPVEFRVLAQNENGKNFHYLVIHSPHNIIDGELELITIGEQSDDVVNLESSDNGLVIGNLIKEVVLEEGRNKIKILFSDNMRHAIKLKAYENI